MPPTAANRAAKEILYLNERKKIIKIQKQTEKGKQNNEKRSE